MRHVAQQRGDEVLSLQVWWTMEGSMLTGL